MKDDEDIFTRHKHHRGFSGGFILMALGFILLLNNFNILPWDVWSLLWKLWPVFLILWGLEILFGENLFGEIILSLVTFLIVIFVIIQLIAGYNSSFKSWMQKRMPWMLMYQQMFNMQPGNDLRNFFNNSQNNYY